MYFSRALFLGASFAVAALAQSNIAFTQVPAEVTAGEPTELMWGGGDGESLVTITLKKGDPDNLQSVAILTGDATGNSYTWTPSTSLPNGVDYALQISQGVDDVNYSGQFPLTGGATAAASTGTVSSTAASSSTTSSSDSGITPLPVPIPVPINSEAASSVSAALSSLNGTLSSILSNNSAIVVTTTVGTAAGAGGTGVPISRNTTMSSATLSSPSTGGIVVGGSSTAGSSASSTGSAPASTTTAAGSAAGLTSPLALVLSAVVAMLYLN
ncbi:hypothetical protein MMC24_002265 [Lignoscripta atroalba]|nr:hypothetical protein [Lignoscripta atroalba]